MVDLCQNHATCLLIKTDSQTFLCKVLYCNTVSTIVVVHLVDVKFGDLTINTD